MKVRKSHIARLAMPSGNKNKGKKGKDQMDSFLLLLNKSDFFPEREQPKMECPSHDITSIIRANLY